MAYQKFIHDIDPTVNPAGVEASMRLQYGTLDHLDRHTFVEEIILAKQCEKEQPGYLRRTAASYGLTDDYNKWESTEQETPEHETPIIWQGERVSNRLHLRPSQRYPTLWEIYGRDPHTPGLADSVELVKLAHTILAHIPGPTGR